MPAVRVGLVVVAADRRERAAAEDVPLLDLVVVALDVGAGRARGSRLDEPEAPPRTLVLAIAVIAMLLAT